MKKQIFSIGQKFNNWTVVDPESTGRPSKLLVQCVCGTKKYVAVYTLTKGTSKGCAKCRVGEKAPNWNGIGNISKTVLSYESQRTGLSIQQLENVYINQSGTCPITTEPLQITGPIVSSSHYSLTNSPRIAPINSSGGISVNNAAWVDSSVYSISSTLGVGSVKTLVNTQPNIFEQLGFNKRNL